MAMSYDQRLDTYICPYIYIFHLKTFISAQSRFCSLLSRFSFFLCIRLFLSLLFSLSVFIYLLFNWMYLFRYRAAFLQNCSFFLILRLSLFLALSVCLSLAFALSVFLFLSAFFYFFKSPLCLVKYKSLFFLFSLSLFFSLYYVNLSLSLSPFVPLSLLTLQRKRTKKRNSVRAWLYINPDSLATNWLIVSSLSPTNSDYYAE